MVTFERTSRTLPVWVLAAGAFVVACTEFTPGTLARSLAIVHGGITTATALGVPLNMVLGQAAGWRLPFLVLGLLGVRGAERAPGTTMRVTALVAVIATAAVLAAAAYALTVGLSRTGSG